jgi:hypothetical protein
VWRAGQPEILRSNAQGFGAMALDAAAVGALAAIAAEAAGAVGI